MKKTLPAIWFLILFCTKSLSAQDPYHIVVQAGSILSTNGTYATSDSTSEEVRDLVKPGTILGLGVQLRVNRHYHAETLLSLAWMYYKDDKNPTPTKSPTFAIQSLEFNNVYYLFGSDIRPFLSGGIGIYYWRFTKDGPFSDAQTQQGERLQKMSIGGNLGLGAEISLSAHFALRTMVTYHYILSKDEFFFGKGFSEQGLVTLSGGLSWCF